MSRKNMENDKWDSDCMRKAIELVRCKSIYAIKWDYELLKNCFTVEN